MANIVVIAVPTILSHNKLAHAQYFYSSKSCFSPYLMPLYGRQHMLVAHQRIERELPLFNGLLHKCNLARGEMVHFVSNLSSFMMFEVSGANKPSRLGDTTTIITTTTTTTTRADGVIS